MIQTPSYSLETVLKPPHEDSKHSIWLWGRVGRTLGRQRVGLRQTFLEKLLYIVPMPPTRKGAALGRALGRQRVCLRQTFLEKLLYNLPMRPTHKGAALERQGRTLGRQRVCLRQTYH